MNEREEALHILTALLSGPLVQVVCMKPSRFEGQPPTLDLDHAIKLAFALQESFDEVHEVVRPS